MRLFCGREAVTKAPNVAQTSKITREIRRANGRRAFLLTIRSGRNASLGVNFERAFRE